jgi:glucose-6-phosphate 1-dehydrogenase
MSKPEACTFVIFGASGDLARRKLLPAIYNLAESKLLPDSFAVLGVARSPIDDAAFRAQMRQQVQEAEGEPLAPELWSRIESCLGYLNGDFDDSAFYERLKNRLAEIDQRHKTDGHYLFYLAVPPELFSTIVRHLAEHELTREQAGVWRRIIIEKPFGYDLDSACALNAKLSADLKESARCATWYRTTCSSC